MNILRACARTICILAFAVVVPGGFSQETPKPPAPPPPAATAPATPAPAAPAPASSTPAASTPVTEPTTTPAKPDELREQTIYIPYNKLRETFEKEGRGVFVPYEQFQELWKQARQAQHPTTEKPAPQAVVLTDIESEATVERDVVVVKAKVKFDVIGKGWHEVPLRLSDSAIRTATIDGQPARIVYDANAGYKLLMKHDSAEPKSFELTLEYARAFSKTPGLNSVQFAAPQAPINRWRIRIPQPGVKVNVQPMIAATEVPATAPSAPPAPAPPAPATPVTPATPPAGETVVLAFVGAAPEVRIDWTPKTEGATGLDAISTAQAQHEITLEEGVLRTRVRLTYEISRAEIPQLLVEIPADQKVTSVFDPNVRQWEVAAQGDKQTITIHLFEPAKRTQNVTIELEKFSDQFVMSEVNVPVVKAIGVGRQQGLVVVRIGDELRAEPIKRSGLLQQDNKELPQPLQSAPWSFAYRYAALPFELALRVEKVKPRIRTDELVEVYLEPEQATINLLAVFDIQQAGVFQLEFDIPAGYDLRQVQGRAASGAEAAAVDAHTLEGENKTRLKVNLARKAIGRVGLFIELYKRLQDPNLLTPTGSASQLPWPLPRSAMNADSINGRVIFYGPESLRITPEKQTGVRAVAFAEAIQGMESQRQDRFPNLRDVLAYLYTVDPTDLSLSVERRKPQIDVRQLLTARIESGVVKYDATFRFNIRYSSVKTLRIDIPQALATEIRNVTRAVREKTIEPRPTDAAESFVAWSFTGEREFFGEVMIQLTWEQETKELAIGKSMDHPIPLLKPMAVDRAWGQIVIAKAETLDVNPKTGFTNLRPIDPQHELMDGVKIADAARAFEFHEDWSLTITATRYELEDVKRTSIERAVLRMVVTRSNHVSVQALYRVRSAVQRLLIKLPEGAQFDTEPLRLNGQSIALERGDQDEMFIPLVSQNPEQAFVLEIRYTVPGDFSRLDFPVFPAQPPIQSEPAMQKVYMLVYLPEEMALLGSRGPWTNEHANWYARLNGLPQGQDARTLVNWVTEGISVQNNPIDSFATDGRLYTFTTLRPTPPPAGSLHLIAWRQRWLSVALFGTLAIIAVVCLRQSFAVKLGAIAFLVVAIVLAGVFAPTFTMQVLDAKLLLAIGLVLTLWIASMAMAVWQLSARSIPQLTRGGSVPVSNVTATVPSSVDQAVGPTSPAEPPPDGSPFDQTPKPTENDPQQGGPRND